MDIKIIKPHDRLLSSFIKHFYFLRSNDADFRQSYVTFPQLTTPVSLFNHVRTDQDADRRHANCWQDPEAPPHGEVDGIFSRPMVVSYRGQIDEVTIVFEPLGLNQFLKCDLAEVAVGQNSRTFNPYGAEFDQFLTRLFARNQLDERCQLLEDFLLAHYQPFNHDVVSRSLECLTDTDKNTPVSQIARSVGVCHKTLTRLFQRHLGSTPVLLRKIARFRHSLALKFGDADCCQLTQLAHLSNYYDQPQFIKQYRQLTGESPASFFRHVSAIGGRDIFWRMLSTVLSCPENTISKVPISV